MRYSNDLRRKAIQLILAGKRKNWVANLFNIDNSTIYRWNSRYKELGNADYFTGYKTGRKSKITDSDLEKEINKDPNMSLNDLGSKMEVSFMTVYRKLKKLGYSFKKSHGYIKKETNKNE